MGVVSGSLTQVQALEGKANNLKRSLTTGHFLILRIHRMVVAIHQKLRHLCRIAETPTPA